MVAKFIQSNGGAAGSGAPSVVYNSTPTQNNLLVAAVHYVGGGTPTMTSSGWTALTNASATNFSLRMFWKIAGAGESTTVTTSSLAINWDMAIIEYQAADTISTKNIDNSQNNGATAAIAAPLVTPYANPALIVCYGGTRASNATFSNYAIGGAAGVTVRETHSDASLTTGTLFDKIVGMPSGAYSGTTTAGTSGNCGAGIAVFNLRVNGLNNYAFVSAGDGMSVTEKIR